MTTEPTKGAEGWTYGGKPIYILGDPDSHGRTPISYLTDDGRSVNGLVSDRHLTPPNPDLVDVIKEIIAEWEAFMISDSRRPHGSMVRFMAARLRERFPSLAAVTQEVT